MTEWLMNAASLVIVLVFISMLACVNSSPVSADEVAQAAGNETITLSDYLGADIYLSKGELDLLTRAYNFYVSHQPEKAVESFETFLKDFPDSPAKEAAFFWLGKSFSELKDFEMAGRLFAEIKQMFPESRLLPHINKEKEIPAPSASLPTVEREAESVRKEQKQAKEHGTTSVIIGGTKYTAVQVSEYMKNASSTTTKLGIKGILWRNGDAYEDFIDEQILFGEAERSAVEADDGRHKELSAKFGLTKEEQGYLYRYLSIVSLIERKVPDIPAMRKVESLSVGYSGGDNNARALLAGELQSQARKGLSFEDIYKAHRDTVKFSIMEFSELQKWVKDAIGSLQDGEISVVWTKDGYMILKTVTKRLSLDDLQRNKPDEVRAFVKKYLGELRNRVKDIEVVKVQ